MHRFRPRTLVLGLALALLAPPTPGSGQQAATETGDPLATFKVGNWIKLRGEVQSSWPGSCTQLKLLTGDLLDDDWSLQGAVRSVDRDRRQFTIGKCRVQVDDQTIYGMEGNLTGFTDLHPGSHVDVEGTFLARGILMAIEVDDESDEPPRQSGSRNQIEIKGKLERVDLRHRTVTIMGMEFQVTPKTQIRSVIR